jgi:zinc protease
VKSLLTGTWLCTWLCAALAAQVKLPPYTHQELPNGVVIDLMPRPGVPLVTFHVLIKGGVEADPPQLAGLANVTAQLLRRGTARRTADQFSEELDFLGGTFNLGSDDALPSATSVSGEFLQKDFDRGLDLLADAILHPTFPEAEVRKLVAQRVDAAKAAKDNPPAAMPSYFRSLFYGPGHPYGRPADELTLARIDRASVAAYHQRMYCGRNMIVIVAGDFDASAAAAKLAKVFGAASAGSGYQWVAPPASARRSQLVLIDKPDATQTYFMIGQPGIDRRNPDRVTLMLVNTLFGGRFTSMLNDELRVNTGLSYGASSLLQSARLPGAIVITTFTKTDSTGRAIDLALEVLKRLREKGITAEQLASAKAYVKGTYPPNRLQTSDQLAAVLGDIELYGLGREEVDSLFARIDTLTLDQVNAAIRKYYQTSQLTFVLLGSGSKIREMALKYDAHPIELSIKEPGFATSAR